MSTSRSINMWSSPGVEDETAPAELRAPAGPIPEALRLAALGLHTAGLIHELRQPVFALKALAQLAESQPARAAEYLTPMLEQVRTLEALLGGYSDFSRRPTALRDVFDLRTPIKSAMAVLSHRAVAAKVRVEVELPVGVAVRGSLLAVQQAVVNLGQNALDALQDQPGALLRIVASAHGRGGVIRIADNGPGLPAAIRERLFEPFQTTKPFGTGLGLSLSRDILVASGADLRLSDTSPGACWEIVLPAPGHG